MPFSNPIISGTALVRTAIKSPNYVTGSVGWSINRDGSAEFQNLTARGSLDVGGTPGIWIGPRTDPDFPSALAADARIKAAIVFYTDANNYSYIAVNEGAGSDWTEYGIVDGGTKLKAYDLLEPIFTDPYVDAHYDMLFRGLLQFNGTGSQLLLATGTDVDIDTTDYAIDGRTGPRGFLDSLKVHTAATWYDATAEAIVANGGNNAQVSGSLLNGHRYRIHVRCPVTSATADHMAKFRIRETNLAGAVVGDGKQHEVQVNNAGDQVHFWEDYDATATGSKTFVLTCQRVVGAVSNIKVAVSATDRILMDLEHIGSSQIRTI